MRLPLGVDERLFRDVVGSADTAAMKAGGAIPSADIVQKYCWKATIEQVREVMLLQEFAWAMQERGYDYTDARGMTAKQHIAIQIICQPLGTKGLLSRLKEAGITQNEYQKWMKNPLFAGAVRRATEDIIKDSQHIAHEALLKALQKGDMKAVEYYNQMVGYYNPSREAQIDVQSVLMQVIEIIQRNVKDPVALQNIAAEMQLMAAGQKLSISGEVVNGNEHHAIRTA